MYGISTPESGVDIPCIMLPSWDLGYSEVTKESVYMC